MWDDPKRAQQLGKERVELEQVVSVLKDFGSNLEDLAELAEMANEEQDSASLDDVAQELSKLDELLAQLEFRRMFQGELDEAGAYVEIQSGSGGTEAQDWADMLLRMYLRWAEDKGFKSAVTELSPGEVAGIKSATIELRGEYVYG